MNTLTFSREELERLIEAVEVQRDAYYENARDNEGIDDDESAAQYAEVHYHNTLMAKLMAALGDEA